VSVINVICASCGAMLGAAVPPARHPLFGLAARTARRESLDAEAVVVTARDFMVLEELARLWLRLHEPAARALVEKLERCHVVPPDAVAADVVTLNSRVVFNAEGGRGGGARPRPPGRTRRGGLIAAGHHAARAGHARPPRRLDRDRRAPRHGRGAHPHPLRGVPTRGGRAAAEGDDA
jgi:hypothetical protein